MRRIGVVAAVAVFAGLFVGTVGPASAGGSCFEPARSWSGVRVDLKGVCFWPTVLYVDRNTTVTWTNRESLDHTVTGLGVRWGTTEPLLQGQSLTYRFTNAGVYPYTCIIHPGMVAAVVVGKPIPGVAPSDFRGPTKVVPGSGSATGKASSTQARPVSTEDASQSKGWRTAAVVGWMLLILGALATAFVRLRRRRALEPSAVT
jgi:plastocyanin